MVIRTRTILIQALLAFTVSTEKWTVNLMDFPLYITSCFFSGSFQHPLFWTFNVFTIICHVEFLFCSCLISVWHFSYICPSIIFYNPFEGLVSDFGLRIFCSTYDVQISSIFSWCLSFPTYFFSMIFNFFFLYSLIGWPSFSSVLSSIDIQFFCFIHSVCDAFFLFKNHTVYFTICYNERLLMVNSHSQLWLSSPRSPISTARSLLLSHFLQKVC